MNESINRELMVAVERVVRPVQASLARKRRMREELMAHLSALHEEERQAADARPALIRAIHRLGDPAELKAQLQQSVPATDRLIRLFEYLLRFPVEESPLRRAGRQAGIIFAVSALQMVLFRLGGPLRTKPVVPALAYLGFLPIALSVLAIMLVLLAHAERRMWSDRRNGRSRSLAVSAILASLCVPGCVFIFLLGINGDAATSIADLGRLSCPSVFLFPILLLAAYQEDRCRNEDRYRRVWAGLELE